MLIPAASLRESFSALADATRCRMLLVLERHELTVSELCVVLQLPQSTVSRHLRMLADAELVASRREGTSRYYSLDVGATDAGGPKLQAGLWQLARRELVARPAADQDFRRLEQVLAARSAVSREFFATSAERWDRLRDELFGDRFYWRALLGLLPPVWVIGDLGCGTGAIAAALAPHVAMVIGVDASDEMLQAAARRLAGTVRLGETVSGGGPPMRGAGGKAAGANVDLRRGSLEALPIEDAALDAATFVLVLHHLPAPAAALAEAHRVLKPGGRLLIADMTAHEREEYRQQMGHVWLGFAEDQVRRLLDQAGFCDVRYHGLPAVTDARGPALFAASATKHG